MQDNQYAIPQMGFGTYGRTGPAGIGAMLVALETGYRHLDTAQDYGTERETGQAVQRSGLNRHEVFLTTKIATGNLGSGQLVPSLRQSADNLQVDALDLTLIHWPSPNNAVPLAVYIEQLAQAHALGLTRLIGVSNFPIAMLAEAQALLGDIPIANNQVELNPLLQNKKLANYCTRHAITVTCYLPIARGTLGDVPAIAEMARRLDATPEQIALAFEFAKGFIAIPTSSKPERIRSNFQATTLALSPEDIRIIETLDAGHRVIDPAWGPDWD